MAGVPVLAAYPAGTVLAEKELAEVSGPAAQWVNPMGLVDTMAMEPSRAEAVDFAIPKEWSEVPPLGSLADISKLDHSPFVWADLGPNAAQQ